ncbi:MAG: Gfo/Idh/MocA family oxidoreductase [Phycisphaerales bacterium]|nr:Gfo/Idh/MocA family oxidoreductase [Phycisphaerales bacterium]
MHRHHDLPTERAPLNALAQSWRKPSAPRSIVCIGGGGIVSGAHIPAYRAVGFEVTAVFDLDATRAAHCASLANAVVVDSLEQALALDGVVFDLAVPPQAIAPILEQMPVGSAVLIQKPFGRDLAEASRILAIIQSRHLVAAVNFQLRFSPSMLALHDLVTRGALGRIIDCEMSLHCVMPWENWPFLAQLARMEFVMHSIHYLDLVRHFLGEPRGVWAQTVAHPSAPQLASSRSVAILDYGAQVRAFVATNHHHHFGNEEQRSEFRIEGTNGAAIASFGANLLYPQGAPDSLRVFTSESAHWRDVPLRGSWFPEAFEGPMCNLQRYLSGEDEVLVSSAVDAWRTMALVEACYASSASGATPIPQMESLEERE